MSVHAAPRRRPIKVRCLSLGNRRLGLSTRGPSNTWVCPLVEEQRRGPRTSTNCQESPRCGRSPTEPEMLGQRGLWDNRCLLGVCSVGMEAGVEDPSGHFSHRPCYLDSGLPPTGHFLPPSPTSLASLQAPAEVLFHPPSLPLECPSRTATHHPRGSAHHPHHHASSSSSTSFFSRPCIYHPLRCYLSTYFVCHLPLSN